MAEKQSTTIVFSASGTEQGIAKSSGYRCQMEGCTGKRLAVKWPDGKMTRPCTKGMFTRLDGNLQIG